MTAEFKLVPVELLNRLLHPVTSEQYLNATYALAEIEIATASPQAAQPVAWQYRHRFEEDGEVEIGLWQHCEQKIYDLLQGRKNTDTRQLFTSNTVPTIYDEAKERQLFEAFQIDEGGNIDFHDGYYDNVFVQSAWDGWKQCAQSLAKAGEVL